MNTDSQSSHKWQLQPDLRVFRPMEVIQDRAHKKALLQDTLKCILDGFFANKTPYLAPLRFAVEVYALPSTSVYTYHQLLNSSHLLGQ